jgi:hypothetical protein
LVTEFSDTTCILPQRADVEEFNINKLRILNSSVARINAIHTGSNEAHKTDLELAKGLKAQLLLARDAKVMLRSNLWMEADLINGSVDTV